MSGLCLWYIGVRSVLKMFARFIFRMEKGMASKNVSSKCLQVVSRQSNFGELEKCLKKQIKKKRNNNS